MLKISSLDNKKIKEVVSLYKNNKRQASGLIVVDGLREVISAKQAGLEIVDLFHCPELSKKGLSDFIDLGEDRIIEVSGAVFNKICYKEKGDGFLAVIKKPETNINKLKLSKNPLIIIIEAVEKPGNLGAIIRTAYAAKVDAVIINEGQTDIYNPNVVRGSEGLVFFQPIYNLSFKETVKFLKANKIKTYAAGTKGSINYLKADYKGPCAIVLGSESDGLSEIWLNEADKVVKIDMREGVDSLNVSVSAAIITFEALRQRGKIK